MSSVSSSPRRHTWPRRTGPPHLSGRGAALALGLSFSLTTLAAACSPGPVEPSAVVASGQALYETYCLGCHGGAEGGAMMDWPPRHNANGHTWHHPDCQLVATVLDGSSEMGEMMRGMMGVPRDAPRMPAFRGQLSEQDVRAILAYLKTWWTPQQRDFQRRVTEAQC